MQFFVTCHFQKFVVFLAVKMAAYEELVTPIHIVLPNLIYWVDIYWL